MSRRIILFLALLLPLQFAWANAAAYCAHEVDPSQARHFGHHEHRHEADVGVDSGLDTEKPLPAKLVADSDCGTCHTAGAPVILDASAFDVLAATTAVVVPHAPRRVPTALARAPDRPQWLCLA